LLSNKKPMKIIYLAIFISGLFFTGMLAQTQEITVEASRDNSIFDEGELSNGIGEYIFTGVTQNGDKRRALLMFDLTKDIPDVASVDSAFLFLIPSKVKTAGTTVSIHKLTSDWGEGTSNAEGAEGKGAPATDEDVTWTKMVFSGEPWVKPGGDYELEASASNSVSLGTDGVFGSSTVTADVNAWLNDPASNYGWIVIGTENSSSTAIRFGSRENINPELRPYLKLYYQGNTSFIESLSGTHTIQAFTDGFQGDLIIRNAYTNLNSQIEIYSITGSLVYADQVRLSEGENRISTGIDQPGIYIYRIHSEAGNYSGKLMFRFR